MNQEREAVARLQRFCDAEALAEVYGEYVSPLGAMRADIRDILALRSGGEGWQLVPVEATREMLDAGEKALGDWSVARSDRASAKATYRAMLAAAPSPSIHGEG